MCLCLFVCVCECVCARVRMCTHSFSHVRVCVCACDDSLYCKAAPCSVCCVHLAVLGTVGGGLASSAHGWLLQRLGAVAAQRGIAADALGRCVLRPWHLESLGNLVKREAAWHQEKTCEDITPYSVITQFPKNGRLFTPKYRFITPSTFDHTEKNLFTPSIYKITPS